MESTSSTFTSHFPKSSGGGNQRNYRKNGNDKYFNQRNTRFANKSKDGFQVVEKRHYRNKRNNRSRYNERNTNNTRFANKSKDGFQVVEKRHHRNKRNNRSHYNERNTNNTRITTEVKFSKPQKPVYKEEFPTLGKKSLKPPVKSLPVLNNNAYSVLSNMEQDKQQTLKKVVKPQGVWGNKISHAEHLVKKQSESVRKLQFKLKEKKKKLVEEKKSDFNRNNEYTKPISYHSNYYNNSDEHSDGQCDYLDNQDNDYYHETDEDDYY